jgi:hypothetical protein
MTLDVHHEADVIPAGVQQAVGQGDLRLHDLTLPGGSADQAPAQLAADFFRRGRRQVGVPAQLHPAVDLLLRGLGGGHRCLHRVCGASMDEL